VDSAAEITRPDPGQRTAWLDVAFIERVPKDDTSLAKRKLDQKTKDAKNYSSVIVGVRRERRIQAFEKKRRKKIQDRVG